MEKASLEKLESRVEQLRLRRKIKVGELKKNKCQWKLPIEYAEMSGVVAVGRKESKARREEK